MESVKRLVDRVLEVITITLFLVMVGVTTWQVISRYVLNAPSSMTEEFVKFSLIWLSMLSAAYVVGKKSHIAITLLRDRKSTRLNSSHVAISYAVFCLKKKKNKQSAHTVHTAAHASHS